MLIINGHEVNIITQEIKVGSYIINGKQGYDVVISLEFNKNNKVGYICLSAGYELEKNIYKFLNRVYKSVPFFDSKEEITLFEVFDTEHFYDTEIESEIYLNIKNIINNKIEVDFEVNDKLIKIKYNGLLNITQ